MRDLSHLNSMLRELVRLEANDAVCRTGERSASVDNHSINSVIVSLIDPDEKTALPELAWDQVIQAVAAAEPAPASLKPEGGVRVCDAADWVPACAHKR